MLEKNKNSQGRREEMNRPKAERRLYPRIEKRLPIKVGANGYDFATTTENLSSFGAYCHIGKYVPPFTKIAIRITLPVNSVKGKKDCDVECKGVIVRTEDEKTGGFNIAVFFNDISGSQQQKISRYINQFLP